MPATFTIYHHSTLLFPSSPSLNTSSSNTPPSPHPPQLFSLPLLYTTMAPMSSENDIGVKPQTRRVCVMDASGHLGTNLVNRLLDMGFAVHAAVHSHGSLQDLKGMTSGNKNLSVFHTDPFDYQSILDALHGCSGLFYSFEPPHEQLTYDEFMAETEVRAAHNVLEACAQTETMEKVVFTSSVTAVIWRDNRKSVYEFDERSWSEPSFCRTFKLWHAMAKTLAEKTAWALAMDREVSMVAVNAGLLTAPGTTAADPSLKGVAEMYEDGVLVTVDVGFLVDALLRVFHDSTAYGRYLCFNNVVNRPEDALGLAQMLSPAMPTCSPSHSEELRVYQQRISNKKLNKLMVGFRGEIEMLI